MNGRTCQLCGKPLSRFTVGSGGDFCSREHRNQFRLRLGMDRLLEANKVASLMRRRENAKTIPATQLASDCKVLPRTAPALRAPVRPPGIHSLPPRPAALAAPRLCADSGNLLSTRPAPAAGRSPVRPLQSSGVLSHQRTPLLPPPRVEQFPVRIPPAGALAPRPEGTPTGPRAGQHPRQPAALGHFAARTNIGGNGIQLRALPRPVSRSMPEPQRPRRLANVGARGRELRVSGGVGFRLPLARIRAVPLAGPLATALVSFCRPLPDGRGSDGKSRIINDAIGAPTVREGLLHGRTEPRVLATASQPQPAERRLAAIPPSPRGLFGPAPPVQENIAKFRWPTVIAPGARVPLRSADAARTCETPWRVADPRPPNPPFPGIVTRLNPSTTPLPFAAPPSPRAIQSVRRLTLVRFEGQDSPFEYSLTAIHGTLVGGMQFASTAPRKADPAQPATIQEHFDAGWNNWLGGTDDWRVDAAGVRTGSLALFAPSLEMADYDLEFLARIENRSVSWVFRAANFNDFYQATLAVTPSGGYELKRRAFIGGVAEAAMAWPVAIASSTPAARSAVTVRTRTSGNTFSISLDGKVIDTWTDARLALGGIGFVSAPDDRARLYWVKVTPTGQISKEHRKQ